jgi:hypothetical protein
MNDLALKMKDETDARQGKMMQILVRCILRCSCWQNTLTMCVPYKEREREGEKDEAGLGAFRFALFLLANHVDDVRAIKGKGEEEREGDADLVRCVLHCSC